MSRIANPSRLETLTMVVHTTETAACSSLRASQGVDELNASFWKKSIKFRFQFNFRFFLTWVSHGIDFAIVFFFSVLYRIHVFIICTKYLNQNKPAL